MTEQALQNYFKAHYSQENEKCEWKEFKSLKSAVSGRAGEDIISYISAIANMQGGHLVVGVQDQTLNIIGIQEFAGYNIQEIKFRIVGNCTNLNDDAFWVEELRSSDTNKIVWVFHIPKHQFRLPVYAHRKAWQRIGDNLLEMTSARLSAIINELNPHEDWSAGIVPDANIDDLDPKAISLAREKFIGKFPQLKDEAETWDDLAFLNKIPVCIKGKITRTAIILLGRRESEHFINPSVAKIRWVLKTLQNEEKDSDVLGCPILLSIDQIYQKIRNLKYQYLPDGTLFPVELLRFEPFNIREAINNCVAHQDYTKAGYINVVEFEDERLVFTNLGAFLPGSVEKVIELDAPQENYRNRFLANAMFQLGLIETRGGGIKKMFINQRKRFFPLPDYEFEPDRTKMILTGKIIDMEFVRILMQNPELSLSEVILLDSVQKRKDISDGEIKHLRKHGLIEGRKNNLYLSHKVVAPTNDEDLKAEYIRNRSFDDSHFKQMIVDYLKKYQQAKRSAIEALILPKLSDALSNDQKKYKVGNLLAALRKDGVIKSITHGVWELI
jgi:ATP-dependent DNA helicase RecG